MTLALFGLAVFQLVGWFGPVTVNIIVDLVGNMFAFWFLLCLLVFVPHLAPFVLLLG